MSMHSASKEQREAVRQLVQAVIICDLSSMTADRFRNWIQHLDSKFAKVAMKLLFRIEKRRVTFSIKEIRTRRIVYHFAASTSVSFEESEVIRPADVVKLTY